MWQRVALLGAALIVTLAADPVLPVSTVADCLSDLREIEAKIDSAMDNLTQASKHMKEMRQLQLQCEKNYNRYVTSSLSDEELPASCAEAQLRGFEASGVYNISTKYDRSGVVHSRTVTVYCDLETDGGGWTVFLRRDDYKQQENFDRTWEEYRVGFGKIERDFWLGNDLVSALTHEPSSLQIDLENFAGEKRYATYTKFQVEPATQKYRLVLGGYSGNAGDALDGQGDAYFSTKDHNSDKRYTGNQPVLHGAWWYKVGGCHLNSKYYRKHEATPLLHGIYWAYFHPRPYHSLKACKMMFRPEHWHSSPRKLALLS